jgi:hypothetical protein
MLDLPRTALRESGDPVNAGGAVGGRCRLYAGRVLASSAAEYWVPAFAGMTAARGDGPRVLSDTGAIRAEAAR